MNFRITKGENGTAWGPQVVVASGKAENAFEFVKGYIAKHPEQYNDIKENAWVDAGNGTIPVSILALAL